MGRIIMQKKHKWKFVSAILLVVLLSLMLYLVPDLLQWISLHPALLVGFIVLVVSLAIYKTHDVKYVKFGLGIVLASILFDSFVPPFAINCFTLAGQEQQALIAAKTSGFAVDSLLCQVFINAFGNDNIATLQTDGNLTYFLIPIFLIAVFSMLILTLYNKKYLVSLMYSVFLTAVVLLITAGQKYEGVYAITWATLFTYAVIPIILFILMTHLLSEKRLK